MRIRPLHIGIVLALAVVAITAVRAPSRVAGAAVAAAPATAPVSPPSPQALAHQPRLAVAFRLDPNLTRSLYMGERWVSPPVFEFAQPGDAFVVRAKVQSIDRSGQATDLGGDWSTGTPGLVEITRGHGEVTIVVREAGEGDLTVATGAGKKTLRVRAVRTADAMQVAFVQ